MGWWKRRKKGLAEEKFAERMKVLGWENPTIEWAVPDILHFQLSAYDESGKVVDKWYLGTRGYNEPTAMFMLVAYGLVEKSERIAIPEEAVQIWSKWLSLPRSIALRALYSSLEECLPLYRDWIEWAKNDVENWEVAEEQIAALSDSCTFRVSAN